MEIRRYGDVLKRWAWLILLAAIIAGAAAYFISNSMAPVYRASARHLIDEAPGSGSGGNEYSQLLTEQILAQTYVEIATTRPVLEETISRLNLPFTPGQLRSMITINAPADRQILVVSVEDTDPQRAADIANTLGEVFIAQNESRDNLRYAEPIQNWQERMAGITADINELEIAIADFGPAETPEDEAALARLQQQLNEAQIRYTEAFNNLNQLQRDQARESSNVVPIESAVPNSIPIRPQPILNSLLAAILGALLALGLVFLVEYLDDTVKDQEQVLADNNVSAIGAIAQIKANDPNERLVAFSRPRDPLSEAYRVLRTNLSFAAIDGELNTILVTSASPGEGKSTTTANLGVVMAQAGKRVIIIDSDLRRPTQHQIFAMTNSHGLTTALLDPLTPAVAHLQETKVKGLRLLSSGPIPPNPAEILSSKRMGELIEELSADADILLFDTPPTLSVTDAAVLAPQVDGSLFVVHVGETRREALKQAIQRLEASNSTVLGVVLNRINPSHGSYYYYQYYSTYTQDGKTGKRRRTKSKKQVGATG